MGREIRMVPPNWEHPRYTTDNAPDNSLRSVVGEYIPMMDQSYEDAAAEWITGFEQWQKGEHEDQHKDWCSDIKHYWEYDSPPDSDSYRPAFTEDATWCQGYETVSEGTPFTPAFETKAELVDWLVANGDPVHGAITKEQAESFVDQKWAPSMIMTIDKSGASIKGGIESLQSE
ncbi:hypothetical protein LCGC14_2019660 [marine sediment metagenome]|uniref:Uncharacterized protein n=1 Tax=marine sediment metagenome TaxID=412755 RepID=A0A0F9HV10_9ZZZZ